MMTIEEKMQMTMLKLQLVETQGALIKAQEQSLMFQHTELKREFESLKADGDRIASEERSRIKPEVPAPAPAPTIAGIVETAAETPKSE